VTESVPNDVDLSKLPVRPSKSLAAHVYQQLRELIRDGHILPGSRIREEDIARNMGVSRTPVRVALSRLQSRWLLAISNGGLSVVEFDRPQIMELYAMRGVLEGASARFAAENASSSDLASLRHIGALFNRFAGDVKGLAKINASFHQAIAEAAHNRYHARMLEELNDYLALLPSTTFAVPGRAEVAQREHSLILAAIENKDADAAEAAAREHIRRALGARLQLMFPV
jgi:DNA-binding GntR family transcriptional regulator